MNHSIDNNPGALREHLKALRAQQEPRETSRGALLIRGRLFTWLATAQVALREAGKTRLPQTIAAFWSLDQEPELQPLLYQWVEEEGLTVSLPVTNANEGTLEFRLWTPDTPMKAGAFGIHEPEGPPAPLPDIVLVPTLGFTRTGDRLGYGKGCYDRTLASWKAAGHRFVSIGIAWACGDLTGMDYEAEPHDIPLDAILTDKGWAVAAPRAEDIVLSA